MQSKLDAMTDQQTVRCLCASRVIQLALAYTPSLDDLGQTTFGSPQHHSQLPMGPEFQ